MLDYIALELPRQKFIYCDEKNKFVGCVVKNRATIVLYCPEPRFLEPPGATVSRVLQGVKAIPLKTSYKHRRV